MGETQDLFIPLKDVLLIKNFFSNSSSKFGLCTSEHYNCDKSNKIQREKERKFVAPLPELTTVSSSKL